LMLLPFNFIYQMSAWTRAIAVSLAIVHAANPRRPVPAGFTLEEIWSPGVSPAFQKDNRWATWHNIFLTTDKLLKWWERSGSKAVRRKATEKARQWMIERMENSDGLGAIYPPMMYSIMALDALNYEARIARRTRGRGVPDLSLICEEHTAIIEALAARDADALVAAVRSHARESHRRLVDDLARISVVS